MIAQPLPPVFDAGAPAGRCRRARLAPAAVPEAAAYRLFDWSDEQIAAEVERRFGGP